MFRKDVAVLLLVLAGGLSPFASAGQADADADFTGYWTCTGRGVMTLVQKDGKIQGTAFGEENEDWGSGVRGVRGVIFTGTVKGRVATLTYRCGNGATGTKTMTLSADGKSFKGEWESARGDLKFKGNWEGSR
jgi:hypothetical protein